MYNSTKMYIPIVELERISLRLHNFERINRAATGVPFRTERGREFFLDSVSPGEKKEKKKIREAIRALSTDFDRRVLVKLDVS